MGEAHKARCEISHTELPCPLPVELGVGVSSLNISVFIIYHAPPSLSIQSCYWRFIR